MKITHDDIRLAIHMEMDKWQNAHPASHIPFGAYVAVRKGIERAYAEASARREGRE